MGSEIGTSLSEDQLVQPIPGDSVEPLQPVEEEEPLSCCLCDGVGVVGPRQVFIDVN